ncbi:MAG: hypothetical protein ABDH28_00420 [Brevinematia bacterium]
MDSKNPTALLTTNIAVSLLLALVIFWLFLDIVPSYTELLKNVSYLFAISIFINFLITLLQNFLLTSKKLHFNALLFLGNFSFIFLPIALKIEQPYYFLKALFAILINSVIFLSSCDFFTKSSPSKAILPSILLSKNFIISILAVAGSILFLEVKIIIISLSSVILVFFLEDLKRFISINNPENIKSYDFLTNSFSEKISSLRKQLDDSNSLINALKLQLELFSHKKKEIFSNIESLKQRISKNIILFEEYENKYSFLENETNQLVGDLSTYILGFEYYLSKAKDTTDGIRKIFASSYEEISSKITKRDEITKILKDINPILSSFMAKIDSVTTLLTDILTEESKVSTNMEFIFDELSALSVISTNVQIESFKTKASRTMDTVVNEIVTINNNIKNYVLQMQNTFNKFKDLFEYLSSSSQSILKHSDRIKYNIGLAGETLDSLMNVFHGEVYRLSETESKFKDIDNTISMLFSQIKKFRDFLEKITIGVSLFTNIKQMLVETKSILNETLIILEEIQQGISEE